MKKVEISVIIPVFNGGDKLNRCICALKKQETNKVFEIIVVDDGSNDNSLQEISKNGIRVFKQANQGPAAARNLGVEKSRGDIVLFTDADCEPVYDWIEEMTYPLQDPSISGVKGAYLTYQKKIVPRFVQLEYESKYERMKKDRYIDFIDTYSAGFIKNDSLLAGKYDTRFPSASVEDQELSFRMWEKGYKMVFNPRAKVYHTHSDGLWNYMKKKFKIGFWKVLVLREHPKKIIRDSHTPQLLKLEMVFSMLFLVFLFLWPIKGEFLLCALFSLGGFFVAASPFILETLKKKDPTLALFTPLLLFARATSLSFGLIVGIFNFYVLNVRYGSVKGCGHYKI